MKALSRIRPRLLGSTLALVAGLGSLGHAQTTLFFDDFNGPSLNGTFQASLPQTHLTPLPNLVHRYLGASRYSFASLDGASVLRLTNTLNNGQRVGWKVDTIFNETGFRLEARFNVLVQSPTTSIDSFIEMWLINPVDASSFLVAGPSGPFYGIGRQFRSGGTLSGDFTIIDSAYANNAWHRLLIEARPGENVRAALLADDGVTELAGRSFEFDMSSLPAGFQIGVSQAAGAPFGAYPVDVAIDWLRLTTAVPEVGTMTLSVIGLLPILARRKFVRNRGQVPSAFGTRGSCNASVRR